MRVVVCSVGGHGANPFELPASTFADRARIAGGERTLYELAVAARGAGHEVELRGWISKPVLDEISRAAGAPSCAPTVGLPARPATAEDVVIVPEGYLEPLSFVSAVLAPSRAVMMILGPPGLFGWSFTGPPSPVDPLTVDPEAVGQAQQFRVIEALGFEIWTNSPGTAASCQDARVPCTFLGTGTPVPFPPVVDKSHDIAIVEANKWSPLATEVAAQVAGATCLRIPEVHDTTLASAMAPARILVWPSRIEGDSRIQREARAVGTVPVALRSNRFAAQLDPSSGAVVVDDVGHMAAEIRRLLDNPAELSALSERAVASARRQVDWPAYVGRVAAALDAPAPPPARAALGVLGASLIGSFDAVREHLASIDADRHRLDHLLIVERVERQALESARTELASAVEVVRAEAAELATALAQLQAETSAVEAGRSAIEAQLQVSEAQVRLSEAARMSVEAHVVELDQHLQAFRARRVVRFIDRFLAAPLRALRLARGREGLDPSTSRRR